MAAGRHLGFLNSGNLNVQRATGAAQQGGLAPPPHFYKWGLISKIACTFCVPKYFAEPFWSHKRNYSKKKLVES